MAKQYFLPRKDEAFITWHDTFTAAMVLHGPSLGFSAGEVTAVQTDNGVVHTKWNAHQAAKTAAQSATADKDTNFGGVRFRSAATAKRAKAHPNHTPAIGQAFGTIGAEDTTDLLNAKPTLTVTGVPVQGDVQVGFVKSTADGVMIESKRGAETAFALLAIDTEPDYTDSRLNLSPGPETRQYRARYFLNDAPIGNWSDILSVTVPG